MLWNTSGIHGYTIAATDGAIGTVSDVLFSSANWRIRWLVVDTGNWLPGRHVLLHPSALGEPDAEIRQFPVKLTKMQVKDSPEIHTHMPVSMQMESRLYDYYGWDPAWGETYALQGAMAVPLAQPLYYTPKDDDRAQHRDMASEEGDPDLRSAHSVSGYHLHATDGDIGHVSDFLVEDQSWIIRYLKAETSNWWVGKTVLISPRSIGNINWSERTVDVSLTRDAIKASPPYKHGETVDGAFDEMSLMANNLNWIAPL